MCMSKEKMHFSKLVAHTGFEPVVSALRGQCPRPLDECAICREVPESASYPSVGRGVQLGALSTRSV